MANFDVVTCGELLIDFVALETGVRLVDAHDFEKAAGGAPANVAVGLARLGHKVGFLGQVGEDDFGDFLAGTLQANRVDTTGLRRCREARTALAFVSLKADGERDFMFYRHPSADMLWRADDHDLALSTASRVFHFGSISLISEPSRSSTIAAVEAARASGALISYDPNLRVPLWPSLDAAREGLRFGLAHANIVKMSLEELAFLSGVDDVERGARRLWHDQLRLLTITSGIAGCTWFTLDGSGSIESFPVTSIDTTGAGDAFVAGVLAGLIEADFRFEPDALQPVMRLANAAGALTVTKRGAIPALPTRAEVEAFLSEN
ncbi:MAG: PfkB family carbohydrate kinase [Nitrolancea sp.]